jgi:serine/threonine protein kinase
LAPEILEVNKFKQLSEKCDIFSLGLSFLEILFKIELPQNGLLWHEIRSVGFKIPSEFLRNSNLKQMPNNLINLIQDMIIYESHERKDLNYLIENYPELRSRYERLSRNIYALSYSNFIKLEILSSEYDDHSISKRSNSYKFSFNNSSC